MRTKEQSSQRRIPRESMLLAISVIILVCCSRQSLAQQWETNGDNIRNTNAGNVGIGTTSPATKLEISDVSPLIQMSNTSPIGVKMTLGVHGSWSGFSANRNLATGSRFDIGKTTAGYFMWVGNGDSLHWWGTTPTNNAEPLERMRLDRNGNLGIGTTAPSHRLDVAGAIRSSSGGFVFPDGTVQTTAGGGVSQWTTLGTSIFYNGSNVGIGTTAPAYMLDVVSSSNLISRFGSVANQHSQLLIDSQPAFNSNLTLLRGGSAKWYMGNRASNDRLSFVEATGSVELLALLQNGNLGIGTVSPTEKLEVIGNIKVSGNINAKYQDVAEWVESSQEIVAGTVVILDSSRSNHVIRSTQSYDSRVAGVISRQPGLTLGEAGQGRVLVATTGRVKVKVEATTGPIEIGDLLVTSNREGFAMKSLPVDLDGVRMHRPGTLIGKALEPLASGTGEILVLLSLQ